ncbi:MAG: hypothetical protein IH605_15415 [Burkholderiales bacterium]|nr:hypothetical protein [Burkholderiales bacterium]
MRWVFRLAVVGAVVFGMARWLTRPAIDIDTFVETQEGFEEIFNKGGGMTSSQVNMSASESVIRWPAWKSNWVSAAPLELRIKKNQWAHDLPLGNNDWIGPLAVALRLDWPESDEERAKKRKGEVLPVVVYFRNTGLARNDLLYSEGYRAERAIRFATPMDAPREESAVIYCEGYGGTDCTIHFEYLGRPVELRFPRRRFDDWEDAYQRARRLLASVGTPIRKK